jgi:hypothetical protein
MAKETTKEELKKLIEGGFAEMRASFERIDGDFVEQDVHFEKLTEAIKQKAGSGRFSRVAR